MSTGKPQFGMMYGWVLEQPGLTLIDVKTYWALTLNAYHGVVKGKSLNDIAKQAGHDARKVRDSVKKLEALGAITVERTFSSLGYATNVYTIVSGVGTEQSVPRDSTVPTLGTVESGGWGPHGPGGRDSTVRTTTTDQNQTKNPDTTTTTVVAAGSDIDFIPLAKGGRTVAEVVASAPKVEPAPAPVKPNTFAEHCLHCNKQVAVGEGTTQKNAKDKWQAVHLDGQCPATTTTTIPTHTSEPYVEPTPEEKAETMARLRAMTLHVNQKNAPSNVTQIRERTSA